MFRRVPRGNVVVIIVVYVDDLLVACETKRDEEQVISDPRSFFPIKDLGETGFYLGCHITRDRDAGTLKFDQQHYVRTMGSKFSVEKTSTTPAAAGAKTPVQGRCPTDRGEDGRNACYPIPGGGRGPHVDCDHDPPRYRVRCSSARKI